MKFVPRREKVRKGFSSPDGLALLAKVGKANGWNTGNSVVNDKKDRWTANPKTTEAFIPGAGHVQKVTPLYDQEKDK